MTGANSIGRALDDTTLCIWLDLVRLGGYWQLREFRAEHWSILTANELRVRLRSLVDNDMVRERLQSGKHASYGVTTMCAAPPGYEHLMTEVPA